ncbi:MAG: Rieske 2Fe-2S domain-containing protein [Planctomycetaceae bacterium]|nr:Rieske 2Fe-2S domain-containing protein [Planctomycetaceae bacterium]
MFGRLKGLFGRKPILIRGTGKLPEGEARKVSIGDPLAGTGFDVVLARVGGKLYALHSDCPHEGGHLVQGPLVEGKYVRCPLHNYHFDPKNGACVNATCSKAKALKVEEKDGDAEVYA